jgi:undecaprenyl-diphosphatase
MTLFESIVLGVVQGVTEFLPISSTAHLILVPWAFHWQDPGLTFDVVLHAGTLLAILAYFWKDWFGMLLGVLPGRPSPEKRGGRRLLGLIVLGTIPGALVGVLAERAVETWLRSAAIIACSLIGLALLLWWVEKRSVKSRSLEGLYWLDSLLVGCAQAIALIPGVSRSGITITAGLFRGFTRATAARFSFLLSAPIIAGAGLKKAMELGAAGIPAGMAMPMLVGFLASFLSGFLTIWFLLRYLQRNTLEVFIIYRIVLGAVIFFLIFFAGFQP